MINCFWSFSVVLVAVQERPTHIKHGIFSIVLACPCLTYSFLRVRTRQAALRKPLPRTSAIADDVMLRFAVEKTRIFESISICTSIQYDLRCLKQNTYRYSKRGSIGISEPGGSLRARPIQSDAVHRLSHSEASLVRPSESVTLDSSVPGFSSGCSSSVGSWTAGAGLTTLSSTILPWRPISVEHPTRLLAVIAAVTVRSPALQVVVTCL